MKFEDLQMARLGSIIEDVYASGAATHSSGKSKSKDRALSERMRALHVTNCHGSSTEFANALIDDRIDYPSLDGTSSSASLDFSNYEEEDSNFSPREVSWANPRADESENRAAPTAITPLGWPLKREKMHSGSEKLISEKETFMWEEKREKRETEISEVEMMKERFARLLLGEDMSGGSKGVCTALAISNAITNLSASVFGELWRLEPLCFEKKNMWRREMEWLLSVTDHIVELVPTWQNYPDGTTVEIMISNPRADLHINLPALRKLDTILLETLDSFMNTEFWYVEQGLSISDSEEHVSTRNSLPRQEEKWWLPTPRVPLHGLSIEAKKRLLHQKESTSQVLKAAMAINAHVLSEIQVPDVYWDTLPKNGRSSLGEGIYRCLTFEHFSAQTFLSSLDLSTEHNALEIANRLEAAIHAWRRKMNTKLINSSSLNSRQSWGDRMKDFVGDGDRREHLIDRAQTVLIALKQRFSGLPQTLLDIHKIQYNRDVGQSILESYSRVLESLAFSILSRVDDVLHADADAIANIRSDPSSSSSSSSANHLSPIKTTNLHVSSAAGSSFGECIETNHSPPSRKHLLLQVDNTNFSYARHLESRNPLHSPPERD